MALPLSLTWSNWLLAYYFGPNHPFKIRLFDWVHRLLGRPNFTVPFGQARLSLDINDYLQFEILRTGDFEPEVATWLVEQAIENEIVWDIGANIGSVGLRVAQDSRVGEVHCFEPHPTTFQKLLQNVRLNPQLNVTAHSFALGDRDETACLYVGLDANSGVAGFFPHWTDRSVPVPCWSGDSAIAQGLCPAPTLIKIDVEGYELKVLQGLEKTLRQNPPKAIVFESYLDEQGELIDTSVRDFLQSLGMVCRIGSNRDGRQTVNSLAVRRK